MWGLGVAMKGKALGKELVDEDARLGETVHPLPNFHVDVVMMDQG
jgi:hypothetical protein